MLVVSSGHVRHYCLTHYGSSPLPQYLVEGLLGVAPDSHGVHEGRGLQFGGTLGLLLGREPQPLGRALGRAWGGRVRGG